MSVPEGHHAKAKDGVSIAYQVFGHGRLEGEHEFKSVPGPRRLCSVTAAATS